LNLRQPTSIDWPLWKGILDDIGDYLFHLDMFNWGEPLLHKDTPELVKYAKSKDIRVWVSSNLNAKLTEEYIQRLVKSGLDLLVVSISGVTQETYEKYHRLGNISVVRDNMRRIQSARSALKISTPTIIFKFLVFRHNEHEVDIAKRDYKDWGADEIRVGGAFTDISEYDKRFCQSFNVSAFEPSTIPEYNPSLKESPARKPRDTNGKNRPCDWLYQAFVLNPNGKVSPCCGVWSEKDDFAEYSPASGFFAAWNSQGFQRARKLLRKSRKDTDVTAGIRLQEPHDNCGGAVNTSQVSTFDKHVICSTCPAKWEPCMLDLPQGTTFTLQKTNASHLIATIVWIISGQPSAWVFAFRSAKARLLGKVGNSTAKNV
jgi:MoaA/NifB/PqqE/SkfB family radical SAM enzyme